jgi:drug/metabolite transporter (DMT)-like permease
LTGSRATPLALVAATLAVSVSAILITEARTDAATVVWLRMALAVALLAPWAARRPRHRAAAPRREAALTAVAGICLAVHFLAWTASLAYTSVAASVLLVCVHPLIVTPLGARLYGDRVSRDVVAGIVLAVGGLVVTCAGGLSAGGEALRGDLLALLGAVALAGYLLIGRGRGAGSVSRYSAAAYGIVSAAGVLSATVGGTLHVPDVRALVACFGLATICTVGGHTIFNWTLRRLPASTVSLSLLGEPPLAALLALVVLGQQPSAATIAGGVLILAGLAVTLRRSMSDPGAATVAAID